VLETFDVFCPIEKCMFGNAEGYALYEDDNHLNYEGARMLVDPLMRLLASAPKVRLEL